ncbi:hypothetical protein F5H01DRAFT_395084 [Linnemannia elongata]|nr:hypothetical protein F5H01DRAFT_395084 [Linnemannia elongata]
MQASAIADVSYFFFYNRRPPRRAIKQAVEGADPVPTKRHHPAPEPASAPEGASGSGTGTGMGEPSSQASSSLQDSFVHSAKMGVVSTVPETVGLGESLYMALNPSMERQRFLSRLPIPGQYPLQPTLASWPQHAVHKGNLRRSLSFAGFPTGLREEYLLSRELPEAEKQLDTPNAITTPLTLQDNQDNVAKSEEWRPQMQEEHTNWPIVHTTSPFQSAPIQHLQPHEILCYDKGIDSEQTSALSRDHQFTGSEQRSHHQFTGSEQRSHHQFTGSEQRSHHQFTGSEQRSHHQFTGSEQRSHQKLKGQSGSSSAEFLSGPQSLRGPNEGHCFDKGQILSPASSSHKQSPAPPKYRWKGKGNWRSFLKDADDVRLKPEDTEHFLKEYGEVVAPMLCDTTAAFSVWAHKLAYIHPPEGCQFPLQRNHHNHNENYASLYILREPLVDMEAQVVAYPLTPSDGNALTPSDGKKGRFIVLFRGTAQTPAWYWDNQTGGYQFEPVGWKSDFDWRGVAFASFEKVLPRLKKWYGEWANEDGITFIGHSMGGALALRAMSRRAEGLRGRSKDEAFIYSSAGVDFFCAVRLSHQFDERAVKFVWHKDDIVPKAGHFPHVSGIRVSSGHKDGFPELRDNGPQSSLRHGEGPRHTIPFLAVHKGWGEKVDTERRRHYRDNVLSMIPHRALGALRGSPFGAALGCILDGVAKYKAEKKLIRITARPFVMDHVGLVLVSEGIKENLAEMSMVHQYKVHVTIFVKPNGGE